MKSLISFIVVGLFTMTSIAATVDTKASSFKWKATKKVGDGHNGTIALKSGDVTFKEDAAAKTKEVKNKKEAKAAAQVNKDNTQTLDKATLVMDMKSFTVNDLTGEWKTKFMTHVSGSDFYDVAKYPTATLVLDKQVDADTVSGHLTIKEKTNPVTVDFKKNGDKYEGTFTFDRTAYGVVYGSGNFFKELSADKIINNDVVVDFSVVLKK